MPLPYLDDYLLHLQTDNASEKTLKNYVSDLRVFERFLDEDLGKPFPKFSRRDVDLYKAFLVSRDRKTARGTRQPRVLLSARTVNRMLSAFRSFLAYLIAQDLSCPVPPDSVTLVKTPRQKTRVAELEEFKQLLEAPTRFETNPFIAARNRALFETVFATGMRISELLSLNRDHIDGTGRMFVRGKGKKERFVYLTPRAEKHLRVYLGLRSDDFPALFIPRRGRNAGKRDARLSPNYVEMTLQRYRERLRINVPVTVHSFRHAFATYMAEQGASPAALQILLGHESLDTTTKYVNPSDRFAEETHRKFHPLKNP